MNAPEDALAGILRPHWRTDCSDSGPGFYVRWVQCRCGWKSERSRVLVNVPDLHDIWNAHLAQVLAEYVGEREAQAWDEGYEDGRDDESFDSRGLSSDPDAHLYPHANPYRARAEALGATESAGEGEDGGPGGREAAGPGNRDSGEGNACTA